jgi:15-cis-phytoene synthase
VSATADLAAAYDHCESVTRTQAANFFYGIRLLDRDRRRAMCAAYAFARRVDDIGDGGLAREEKLRLLDREALALRAIEGDAQTAAPGTGTADEVILALGDTNARFPVPAGALGALIDGVRMDVEGVSYESFDELVLYCRRVAGAIGRVCLAIFGLREGAGDGRLAGADALADDLGVALQLTNILRDLREDADNDRVYLPGEDLRRFGVLAANGQGGAAELRLTLSRALAAPRPPGSGSAELARLSELVRFEAERARVWFARGIALAPLLDRRSAACVLAMAGIYRRLLERIEADPEAALRERMSLPTREKAWVAARVMLGGGG